MAVAGCALLAMMGVTVLDVALRYAFRLTDGASGLTFVGSVELVKYLLLAAMLGALLPAKICLPCPAASSASASDPYTCTPCPADDMVATADGDTPFSIASDMRANDSAKMVQSTAGTNVSGPKRPTHSRGCVGVLHGSARCACLARSARR